MQIEKLLHDIECFPDFVAQNLDVSQIAYDSRKVSAGCLFVAIRGVQIDGHAFISQAIAQGAQAVLCEKIPPEYSDSKQVLFFQVKDSRKALAQLSKKFYAAPSHAMKTVGITGTNGKTTLSYLIEALFLEAGYSPTVIGTINFRHQEKVFPSSHTTPESLDLDLFLSERIKEVSDALVMEVSSHAIDQHRVDGIEFDVAIFTNLTPDHLDYHKNLQSYFAAKARLFRELLPQSPKAEKVAVLNLDDENVRRLKNEMKIPVLGYSLSNTDAEVFSVSHYISIHGIEAKVQTPQGIVMLRSPLLGEFNLSNLLAAVATGLAFHIPLSKIEKALNEFRQVPGRMERIENKKNLHVFVDYAHTPDALKNVLETLRKVLKEGQTSAKVITVFGCGGDRDKTKRPLMGAQVAKLSNLAVLTSDNPRSENPLTIIEEVKEGMEAAGFQENKNFWVEADRKKGIELAFSKANPGDVILIAGKGHEDYQILGKQKIHFDDREVAREFLS